MEMIELIEEKIHVQKDIHHIMIQHEHMDNIELEIDLIYIDNMTLIFLSV